jgi:CsoR family transcriptional regulator, copper-sensing transcriptional repressor
VEVTGMQIDEDTKKAQIHRLRRIEGQVRGLQRLIEDENDCVDILTQVSATTRALESFAIQLVEQHLQTCVREASQDGVDPEAKVMEISAAIARLVRS